MSEATAGRPLVWNSDRQQALKAKALGVVLSFCAAHRRFPFGVQHVAELLVAMIPEYADYKPAALRTILARAGFFLPETPNRGRWRVPGNWHFRCWIEALNVGLRFVSSESGLPISDVPICHDFVEMVAAMATLREAADISCAEMDRTIGGLAGWTKRAEDGDLRSPARDAVLIFEMVRALKLEVELIELPDIDARPIPRPSLIGPNAFPDVAHKLTSGRA